MFTRPPLLYRLRRAIRVVYLKRRIAWAEQDALIHDAHALLEPELAKVARAYAARMRAELKRVS